MRALILAVLLAARLGPAAAAAPEIVADTPLTGALVQDVLGDLGEVRVLLSQGANVHHYQMRPSEARALQSADLLIWIGPELTPWLARAAGNLGDGQDLVLLHSTGTRLQDFVGSGPDEVAHGAQDDDEHDDGHDDDHDHGGVDPHAWLDPDNAQAWVAAIADRLALMDPDNAGRYRANATAAVDRIAVLDDDLKARLAPLADSPFIVFHDAYGYFVTHFGLAPPIAISLGDASTPTAYRLSEIRTRVSQSGARCAFPEYGHDPALIGSVLQDSDGRIAGEIDPAGQGIAAGPDFYGRLMRDLAGRLASCLEPAS